MDLKYSDSGMKLQVNKLVNDNKRMFFRCTLIYTLICFLICSLAPGNVVLENCVMIRAIPLLWYLTRSTLVRGITGSNDENGLSFVRSLGTGPCPSLHGYLALLMSTTASFLVVPAIITQEGA